MAQQLDVARKGDVVARWCALAEQRLEHLTELLESGRWRRYHSEVEFFENLDEAKTAVEVWRELSLRKATGDNSPVNISWPACTRRPRSHPRPRVVRRTPLPAIQALAKPASPPFVAAAAKLPVPDVTPAKLAPAFGAAAAKSAASDMTPAKRVWPAFVKAKPKAKPAVPDVAPAKPAVPGVVAAKPAFSDVASAKPAWPAFVAGAAKPAAAPGETPAKPALPAFAAGTAKPAATPGEMPAKPALPAFVAGVAKPATPGEVPAKPELPAFVVAKKAAVPNAELSPPAVPDVVSSSSPAAPDVAQPLPAPPEEVPPLPAIDFNDMMLELTRRRYPLLRNAY